MTKYPLGIAPEGVQCVVDDVTEKRVAVDIGKRITMEIATLLKI